MYLKPIEAGSTTFIKLVNYYKFNFSYLRSKLQVFKQTIIVQVEISQYYM